MRSTVQSVLFLIGLTCSYSAHATAEDCDLYFLGRRQILNDSFTTTPSIKVAFFDADDTLRRSASKARFVSGPSDVEILPGVVEKIKALNQDGYLVAIVSNQGGIPRYNSLKNVDQTLIQTIRLLRQEGAVVHYYDFSENYDLNRKPNIGMAMNLQMVLKMTYPDQELEIDLEHSIMVGDAAYKTDETRPDGSPGVSFSNSDRLFAEALGITFHEAPHYFETLEPTEAPPTALSFDEVKAIKKRLLNSKYGQFPGFLGLGIGKSDTGVLIFRMNVTSEVDLSDKPSSFEGVEIQYRVVGQISAATEEEPEQE